MFPDAKVVEAIGRYGGVAGIIFLIFGVVVWTLARMNGTPEQKEKRFAVLMRATFFFGALALVAGHYAVTHIVPVNNTTTTNTTNGSLSPIVPNNCGSITITDQSAKPRGEVKK